MGSTFQLVVRERSLLAPDFPTAWARYKAWHGTQARAVRSSPPIFPQHCIDQAAELQRKLEEAFEKKYGPDKEDSPEYEQEVMQPVKELLEGFAWASHQSHEHLVTVGRSGSTVNRPHPSERDIAVSPDEEVEILPAPASRAGTVIASNTASRPLLCHLSV